MKLSHGEAQALVSARLDGPLDPVAERELNAHLATCDSCHAFNASVNQLARGLQTLPYLQASPAVTRAVLDHVSQPRSPWAWFSGSMPNALPVASAIAAAVIVVFVAAFGIFRFVDLNNDPAVLPASTQTTTDLAQAPVESPTSEAGETLAVTEDVAATETPVPPTNTVPPTEERPTEAPTAVATATEPPTVADQATTGPESDEIIDPPQTPPADKVETEPAVVPTETIEPTAVPTGAPTVTAVSTDVPTATPTSEPTVVPTDMPTATPTDTLPTVTPVPTETLEPTPPPILPREDPPVGDSTEESDPAEAGDSATETSQTIDPEGEEPLEDSTPDGTDQLIEPSGNTGQQTPDGTEDGAGQGSADTSLGTADVYYDSLSVIPGDPTDSRSRLGLNAEGDLIFSVNPGRVSLESDGLTLDIGNGPTGQVVLVCTENDNCADISSASGSSSGYEDTPIGWLDGMAIYERVNGDEYDIEFHAVTVDPDAMAPIDDYLIGGGDSNLETVIRPYPYRGGLLAPTTGAWVLITSSSVEVIDDNPYGEDLTQVRVNPNAGQVSYVAGGNLIVATLDAPGSPQFQIRYAGTDYDLSPNGDQIAVKVDNEIQIWDTNGTVLMTFPNSEGLELGSLGWFNEGLMFVDLTNQVVRILQP